MGRRCCSQERHSAVSSPKKLSDSISPQLLQRSVSAGGDSYAIAEGYFAPILTLAAERRPAIDR